MIVVLAQVASPFLGQIGSVVCTIMIVALYLLFGWKIPVYDLLSISLFDYCVTSTQEIKSGSYIDKGKKLKPSKKSILIMTWLSMHHTWIKNPNYICHIYFVYLSKDLTCKICKPIHVCGGISHTGSIAYVTHAMQCRKM